MEHLGYSQECLWADWRPLQLHSAQLSYANSFMPSPLGGEAGFVGQSTSERNVEGQADGLRSAKSQVWVLWRKRHTGPQLPLTRPVRLCDTGCAGAHITPTAMGPLRGWALTCSGQLHACLIFRFQAINSFNCKKIIKVLIHLEANSLCLPLLNYVLESQLLAEGHL